MIGGVIYLFIHSTLVVGSPEEDFARDLFGFPIPHPPVWTSFIPYLGYFLGVIFEFFSLHGLVGLVIAIVLFSIGGFLMRLSETRESKK